MISRPVSGATPPPWRAPAVSATGGAPAPHAADPPNRGESASAPPPPQPSTPAPVSAAGSQSWWTGRTAPTSDRQSPCGRLPSLPHLIRRRSPQRYRTASIVSTARTARGDVPVVPCRRRIQHRQRPGRVSAVLLPPPRPISGRDPGPPRLPGVLPADQRLHDLQHLLAGEQPMAGVPQRGGQHGGLPVLPRRRRDNGGHRCSPAGTCA